MIRTHTNPAAARPPRASSAAVALLFALGVPTPAHAAKSRALLWCGDAYCYGSEEILRAALITAGAQGLDVAIVHEGVEWTDYRLVVVAPLFSDSSADYLAFVDDALAQDDTRVVLLAERNASFSEANDLLNQVLGDHGVPITVGETDAGSLTCLQSTTDVRMDPLTVGVHDYGYNQFAPLQVDGNATELVADPDGAVLLAAAGHVVVSGDTSNAFLPECGGLEAAGNGRLFENLWSVPLDEPSDEDEPAPGGDDGYAGGDTAGDIAGDTAQDGDQMPTQGCAVTGGGPPPTMLILAACLGVTGATRRRQVR